MSKQVTISDCIELTRRECCKEPALRHGMSLEQIHALPIDALESAVLCWQLEDDSRVLAMFGDSKPYRIHKRT